MNQRLINVYPEWYVGIAVFNYFKQYVDSKGETIEWLNANDMDIEYIGNRSGNKPISTLLNNLINTNVEDWESKISPILYNKFLNKWNSIFNNYKSIYSNDLSNPFNLKTTMTPNLTTTKERASTDKDTGTITDAKEFDENKIIARNIQKSNTASDDFAINEKQSVNQTTNRSGENQDSTFGFNSETSVPSDSSNNTTIEEVTANLDDNVKTRTQVGGFNETETMDADSNKDTTSGSENLTKTLDTTKASEESSTEKMTGDKTTLIEGTDGKRTLVDLTQEQIEFLKANFYEIVYSDVDTILTMPYYDIDWELIY